MFGFVLVVVFVFAFVVVVVVDVLTGGNAKNLFGQVLKEKQVLNTCSVHTSRKHSARMYAAAFAHKLLVESGDLLFQFCPQATIYPC